MIYTLATLLFFSVVLNVIQMIGSNDLENKLLFEKAKEDSEAEITENDKVSPKAENKRKKLSDEDVKEIRDLSKSKGYSNTELAEKFSVHASTISRILKGKTRKKVK